MTKTALLIGVSGYTDLPPLPAVINDVEAMRQVLENPDIGRFDNVEVCLDPDLVKMRLKIGRLFRSSKKGDLALLFFSGHGMTDNSGRLYLTTPIASQEEYKETSVPASFVHDMMNDSSCKRQIVILDCCYSGAFAKGWQPKGDINIQQQLGGEGRAILTSSSAIQLSFEEEGTGIYTRYLVEGIRTGAADLDQDGKISIEELHEYVQKQVKIVKSGMSPRMYADQDGRDIYLTQAPVNDPELEYRREVEKWVKQSKGELSWINQRTLKRLATQYNLTPEIAERIINEVLKPYDEHKELLKEYQEVFEQAIQEEYPLSDRILRDLQDFQKTLGLRDEDVADIWKEVITPLEETQSTEGENEDIEDEYGGMEDGLSEDVFQPELPIPVPDISKKIPKKTLELKTFEFDTGTLSVQRGFLGIGSSCQIQRERKSAEYFTEDLGNGVTLDMVKIPAGEFLMGSPENEEGRYDRERPQHPVTVESFFMGKYPVTQAQWKAIVSLPKLHRDLDPDPSKFKGENRAVECVSWYSAVEFCARLSQHTGKSYVLPSEAQWEYAARAGTTTPFHFGEIISTDVANYNGSFVYNSGLKGIYRQETTSVGNFKVANDFGLFDMHGNVWEWCADPWHDNYKNAPADGSVWDESVNDNHYKDYIDNLFNLMNFKSNAILRGGSWINNPNVCRSAYRVNHIPRDDINNYVGFRVVCVPGLF